MSDNFFSSRGFLGLSAGLLAAGVSAGGFALGLMPMEGTMAVHSMLLTHLIGALFLFSAVPLFMVGLGTGPLSVLLAAAAGFLGLLLKTSDDIALSYLLFNAVPVTVLSWLALWKRKVDDKTTFWYPEGYLLAILTVIPCLLLILKAYLSRHIEGGLLEQTASIMKQSIQQALAQSAAQDPNVQIPPERLDAVIQYVARILPALAGIIWITVLVSSAYLAQISLRQQGWNLRPRLALVPMVVPQSLLLGVAASGLTAYLAPEPYAYVALNICILLCIPYFFLGLAVAHAFARTRNGKSGIVFLVFFYLFLSLLPWLGILVTLLGTLDQSLSLQQKMLAPKTKI